MSDAATAGASGLWLGIDGALGAFSAALVETRAGVVVGERTAAASGNDALERGIAVIGEVLDGTPLASLTGIAAGVGPGSFTGLRIALSYAKSFAFAASLPLAGVSSYDALTPDDPPATHAVFVHGRAGIACVRLREARAADFVACGTYEALAEALAGRLPAGTELPSFGAPEGAAPALGERGIIVRSMRTTGDVPALQVVRRAMRAPVAANAHAVRADYGEAHYAERDPKARSNG